MQVMLLYSPGPRQVRTWHLTLPDGASVSQALATSCVFEEFPELSEWVQDRLWLAVWGRRAELNQLLQDGDRLEILRPLRVDPMVARRERFENQGVKSAGLFASRRAGAKAGY